MLSRPLRRTVIGALSVLALTATAACGADTASGDDNLNVVAGFYPLQFLAERIGGDQVTVTNLAPPGAEPHDLELKPSQVGLVADAGLVLYLKGFQPELDSVIEQNAADRALDITTVVPLIEGKADDHGDEEEEGEHEGEESGLDPHVWLDPTRLATIADAVGKRFAELDADNAAQYTARAQQLRDDLTALDAEFTSGLANCQRREIITSHAAFGYLADRYKLEQVALTGLTPESEPTPQRLAQVIDEAKEHGATTIFFETLVSPRVAETIAKEVGATTAVLDPLEGLSAGSTEDYLSVMRTNLEALRTALGCA